MGGGGIWIPRTPTLNPNASTKEQSTAQNAEVLDFLNCMTWADGTLFVGGCAKDIDVLAEKRPCHPGQEILMWATKGPARIRMTRQASEDNPSLKVLGVRLGMENVQADISAAHGARLAASPGRRNGRDGRSWELCRRGGHPHAPGHDYRSTAGMARDGSTTTAEGGSMGSELGWHAGEV